VPDSILSAKPRNVMPVFSGCGLLTDRELEITDVEDCVALLEKLHSRQWSALEVTVAFCKRATIAQQLINPLMDMDIEGAIKRATELDDHLSKTGGLVGPLHGLPVSFKVRLARVPRRRQSASARLQGSCITNISTCRILPMSRA
jgi:amidase